MGRGRSPPVAGAAPYRGRPGPAVPAWTRRLPFAEAPRAAPSQGRVMTVTAPGGKEQFRPLSGGGRGAGESIGPEAPPGMLSAQGRGPGQLAAGSGVSRQPIQCQG